MKSLLLWLVSGLCLAAAATPLSPRLIPFDPSLEVAVHEYGGRKESNEAQDRLAIFPRRRVPQIRRIAQPGALLMAVNIQELALLPGDRLVLRDASNETILDVTARNQSAVKCLLQQPRALLWNHPLLTVGNRVTIEYWPSLRTLVLPIDRPQRDNPVVVVDSYAFALFSRRRSTTTTDDTNDKDDSPLESTVGETNEMKPAVCYKSTKPEWYTKSRSVARLMIQRSSDTAALTLTVADGTVGALDPRDSTTHSMDPPSSNTSWTFCTGWLVGRGNYMLTNYHCFFELTRRFRSVDPWIQSHRLRLRNTSTAVSSSSPCSTNPSRNSTTTPATTRARELKPVTVNFMAETKRCNASVRMGERAGDIDATQVEIVAASEALDYCLVRVVTPASKNGSQAEDLSKLYGYLTLRESGPVDGEPVYIPQHPNGEPKTIAATKDGKAAIIRVPTYTNQTQRRSDTSAALEDRVSVRYNADTAPGSSGSPVISQRDSTVVALHHAGTGSRGRGPDGGVSTGWVSRLVDRLRSSDGDDDGGTTVEGDYNVGIRSDAIVADLRKRRVLPPCAVARKCEA